MSEAFAILSGALDEAINDTKTKKLPRNVRSIEIEPVGVYTSTQVKNIREKIGFRRFMEWPPERTVSWIID